MSFSFIRKPKKTESKVVRSKFPPMQRKHEFLRLQSLLNDAEKYDSAGDKEIARSILLILAKEAKAIKLIK